MPGNMTRAETRARLVASGLTPLAVDENVAAALCGVSVGTFHKMVAAGDIPGALSLAGSTRRLWSTEALEIAVRKLAGLDTANTKSSDAPRHGPTPSAADPIMAAIDASAR